MIGGGGLRMFQRTRRTALAPTSPTMSMPATSAFNVRRRYWRSERSMSRRLLTHACRLPSSEPACTTYVAVIAQHHQPGLSLRERNRFVEAPVVTMPASGRLASDRDCHRPVTGQQLLSRLQVVGNGDLARAGHALQIGG